MTALLTAAPATHALGGSSDLTWGSVNATDCTATSLDDLTWTGAKLPSGGTMTVSPIATATYTLTCTGAGGATSAPTDAIVSVTAEVAALELSVGENSAAFEAPTTEMNTARPVLEAAEQKVDPLRRVSININ